MAKGFKSARSDQSLYTIHSGPLTMFILVYVDDILNTRNNEIEVTKLITRLDHLFSLKDLGELNNFLGIEVKKTSDGLFLS